MTQGSHDLTFQYVFPTRINPSLETLGLGLGIASTTHSALGLTLPGGTILVRNGLLSFTDTPSRHGESPSKGKHGELCHNTINPWQPEFHYECY